MSKSTDYHDYVFRDGELVGEFEEMYRNSGTTPWHQDEQVDWIDIQLSKVMVREFGKFDEIHDLGCGTGHYLDLMVKHCLMAGGKSHGYDISATACKRAASIFPYSEFSVLDLTEQIKIERLPKEIKSRPKRLFMIRGTLWYVFPKLSAVIDNIQNRMASGDCLLVVQNFPPLHKSFIGKDVLPNHLA